MNEWNLEFFFFFLIEKKKKKKKKVDPNTLYGYQETPLIYKAKKKKINRQ